MDSVFKSPKSMSSAGQENHSTSELIPQKHQKQLFTSYNYTDTYRPSQKNWVVYCYFIILREKYKYVRYLPRSLSGDRKNASGVKKGDPE